MLLFRFDRTFKYCNINFLFLFESLNLQFITINLFYFFSFRYFCKTTKHKGSGILPFKLQDAYNEFSSKCPILCAVLQAVTGRISNGLLLVPVIYAAAMILMNSRNRKVNAFQKLVSLLLWKGQLKTKVSCLFFFSCFF